MVYSFYVEGFEAMEAVTPIDLLRRAKVPVTTVSLENSLDVCSSSNVIYKADKMFAGCDFSNAECVILPGGPGTKRYYNNQKFIDLVLDCHKSGKLVCGICAAPSLLSKIGIEAEMTVYPSMKDQVAKYKNAQVVKSGNVITGEAAGASVKYALEIIKYLKGEEKATEISNSIYLR